MEKVKIIIVSTTSDADSTARTTKEYLKEILEQEFFFEENGEVVDSVETEILEEN